MNFINLTPHKVTLLNPNGTEFDTKTKCWRHAPESMPDAMLIIEKEFPTSGIVARCSMTEEEISSVSFIKNVVESEPYHDEYVEIKGTIPLIGIKFGEIENLPESKEDTIYIVSSIVANAGRALGRTDLAVPSRIVRDKDGNILGCLVLAIR